MGAPGPVLLLPPSEGKTEGGRAPTRASRFEDRLGAARREVIAGFAAAVDDPVVAAKVLGVRGDLLDRARAAMRALADGTAPVRPAAERYSGVVWEHLGPVATPERHRILVPSAVYGITTAADPVADHRGKLSSSLPGLGRLDRYWRDLVTGTIAHHARGRTVVKTGAEAVFMAALPEQGLGIALKIDDGGTRAAETVMAQLLVLLGEADPDDPRIARHRNPPLRNWRGDLVGERRITAALGVLGALD